MRKKLRIGVIFGGRSGEHEVSLRSAESIINSMDKNKYEVVPIGITNEGRWLTSTDATALLPAAVMTSDAKRSVAIIGDPTKQGLTQLGEGKRELSSEPLDVVFPVLHGTYGEDGTIQGLLELAGVPYVGAGVLASAAGMDKEYTKKLLVAEGLPIGDHVVLRPRQDTVELEDRERLGLPVFVKPARGGSSIGVSRVAA